MTADQLATFAGVIISLAFSYVPGLNTAFAALATETKRAIMLGLMVLVAAVAFGLSCAGIGTTIGVSVTCDQAGLTGLVMALFYAAVANQTTYALSNLPKRIKAIKAARVAKPA